MALGYSIGTLHNRTVSTGNPITGASITIAQGENLLCLKLVVTGATDRAGGAPTLGPYTFVQAGSVQKAAASPEGSAELWYLLNPAPGTYTLTIPNTGALSVRYRLSAAKTRGGGLAVFVAAAGANNTSTNPGATVSCGDGNLILFAVVASGATTWAPSGRSGTQISDTDNGANGDGFQYRILSNPGDHAMSWTFGTSDDWGVCAAAFGESTPGEPRMAKGVRVGDGMCTNERVR